jgi:Phosphate-selective porin O and P
VAVATALGCLVPPSLASNGTPTNGTDVTAATAAAPASDWLGLSGELNGLTSTLQDQMGPTTVGGLIRGAVYNTGDFAATGGDDILGALLDDAKLFAKGSLGDFDWRIMFDFATPGGGAFSPFGGPSLPSNYTPTWLGAAVSGLESDSSANLQEAYGTWNFSEEIGLSFGRFRAHRSFSNTVYSEQLLFQHRTLIGETGYRFDEGVELHGQYGGPLTWFIAAQNGVDGLTEDFELIGRVEWAFGAGASNGEGAIVAPGGNQTADEFNGAVGATYGDEGAASDGSYYGVDFVGRVSGFFFNAEFFQYDDDWAGILGPTLGTTFTEGPAFYSGTVGYLLPDDHWELAARYQDLDDAADTTVLSLGVNYYVTGHNAKWQLNYSDVSSDSSSVEGSLISLGLTLGLEGY